MSRRQPITLGNSQRRMVGAVVALLITLATAVRPALAVLVQSGAANDTAPAPIDNPGFANIGKSSTGGASVTYLGNRYILTVNHATIANNLGPIRFGNFTSNVVDGSKIQLTNGDGSGADLALWQLVDDPGLPAMDISTTAATFNTAITLIGNGRTIGSELPDETGYNIDTSANVIRWGTNRVSLTNQFESVGFGANRTFHTRFDNIGPESTEAQASRGDSGGAAFRRVSGMWQLTGIMFANSFSNSQPNSGPPNFEPLTVVYGNESIVADLSSYRTQIVAVVGTRVVGDVNGNSIVDFSDLGVLLNHMDQPGSLADGDFNGSGTVDFTDLGLLLNNYTATEPPPPEVLALANGSVPEPTGIALGLLCIAVLMFAAWRHKACCKL